MTYTNCPFDVTPYDVSSLIKTPNLTNVNYTNQDFWSMKARLVDFIKERFSDQFNDFVESDLAIMLIENWAFIADTLSFKIDQIANEIFIDTVTEVDNAFRLSTLVGFKPQPPIGARSFWSVTINNALETDLEIPTPVLVNFSTNDGPKTIELFAADSEKNPRFSDSIFINAGQFINTTIVGVEGRTITQQFSGLGTTNQSLSLSSGPVIWNSVRVYVDGMSWNQVDYFTDSQPRREYRIEYDSSYNAFVIFGNNRAGMIPSSGSIINVVYRVGGGTAGNIVTGSLELQRGYEVPGFDFRVTAVFKNYTRGEFGYVGDSIEDIKRKLPSWLRTQNRAVTGDDYETLSDQFVTEFQGQIGKSKAILRQYGCAANVIDLYILALEGTNDLFEASNELKAALSEELQSKKMITDLVCIRDGVVIRVDVSLDVLVDKFYRKFEDEIKERINSRMNTFFSLNKWDYSQDLKAPDMIKELADIKEIKSTEVNFVTDNETNSGEVVTARFFEIIRPGTIDINFIYE
jgi:hypothetical protein